MLQRLNKSSILNQERSRPNLIWQNQTNSFPLERHFQSPKPQHQSNHFPSIKNIVKTGMPSFGDGNIRKELFEDIQNQQRICLEKARKRNPYSLDYHQSGQEYSNFERQGNYKQQQNGFIGKCSSVEKVNEQREQNIDRINGKIKRILDTLSQEERKITNNIHLKIPKYQKGSTQSENWIMKENDAEYYSDIRHLQKQPKQKRPYEENDNKYFVESGYFQVEERKVLSGLSNYQIERRSNKQINKRQFKFEGLSKNISQQGKQMNGMVSQTYNKQYIRQKDIQRFQDAKQFPPKDKSLSFSCLEKSRKFLEQTPKKFIERSASRFQKSEKSCKLSNGKDLDAQIDRIQKKIENFEQMKKQLNLQDDKSTSKSKQILNKSLSKLKRTTNYEGDRERSPITRFVESSPLKTIQKKNYLSSNKDSEFCSQSETEMQKIPIHIPVQVQNKIDSYQNQNISLPKPFKMSQRKSSKRMINNEMKRQMESVPISEQRLSNNDQSIKSLMFNICYQIDLDQTFRNSKKWFSRISGQFKWQELSQYLKTFNIDYDQHLLYQIFSITEEEDNPFHTSRGENNSYKYLIENYLKCCKYWQQKIQGRYTREEIEMEIKNMDIQKRNKISIEDMVRYINLESDKLYRNRDLALIFKRISYGKEEVQIEDVLKHFCIF